MSWLDYFTPTYSFPTESSVNHRQDASLCLLRDNPEDEEVNQARRAWIISQEYKHYYSNQYGNIHAVDAFNQRFFLVHEPSGYLNKTCSDLPLLIFYHGLNMSAWHSALVETDWLKLSAKYGFLVVFGQGQGVFYEDGPIRDKHGQVSFGDLYWEVEDSSDDFFYLDYLLEYMKTKYANTLNKDRIYFMGYSNGGLFSSNVSVHFGGKVFAAICNHCGGFGGQYDESKLLSPETIKYPLPIYILTGTNDPYKDSCLRAKELHEKSGCQVKTDILENRGHTYYRDMEEYIWTEFFLKHTC